MNDLKYKNREHWISTPDFPHAGGPGGVLFIPYMAGEIAALRSVISAWMRLAIFEAMDREEGDQRLWPEVSLQPRLAVSHSQPRKRRSHGQRLEAHPFRGSAAFVAHIFRTHPIRCATSSADAPGSTRTDCAIACSDAHSVRALRPVRFKLNRFLASLDRDRRRQRKP